MMDGRIKTLHPLVHGGILARRGIDDEVMQQHDIHPIDLVVVNLYNFDDAVAKPGSTITDVIEHIDVGGPTMLRAAAKNYNDVVVLSDPSLYDDFMWTFKSTNGEFSPIDRLHYAQIAFAHTAKYDTNISQYLFFQVANTKIKK